MRQFKHHGQFSLHFYIASAIAKGILCTLHSNKCMRSSVQNFSSKGIILTSPLQLFCISVYRFVLIAHLL
ncbi:hypothetical protein C8Q70DRAFT_17534 [Cubamyces menziesii]|nr:hypothetical protein C8Q70DRAFT_17534 [Cubamyces menziesii]